MLLLLNQNMGMAWGEVEVTAIVGGADTYGDREPRKRRRRGDRDHRWDREDPLYASIELQRALSEEQLEEDREDTIEALDVIAEAAQAVAGSLLARGGLAIVPTPPIQVARVIADLPSDQPAWQEILAAVREAERRTRDKRERQQIAAYHARLEWMREEMAARTRDEEDAAELLLRGIL